MKSMKLVTLVCLIAATAVSPLAAMCCLKKKTPVEPVHGAGPERQRMQTQAEADAEAERERQLRAIIRQELRGAGLSVSSSPEQQSTQLQQQSVIAQGAMPDRPVAHSAQGTLTSMSDGQQQQSQLAIMPGAPNTRRSGVVTSLGHRQQQAAQTPSQRSAIRSNSLTGGGGPIEIRGSHHSFSPSGTRIDNHSSPSSPTKQPVDGFKQALQAQHHASQSQSDPRLVAQARQAAQRHTVGVQQTNPPLQQQHSITSTADNRQDQQSSESNGGSNEQSPVISGPLPQAPMAQYRERLRQSGQGATTQLPTYNLPVTRVRHSTELQATTPTDPRAIRRMPVAQQQQQLAPQNLLALHLAALRGSTVQIFAGPVTINQAPQMQQQHPAALQAYGHGSQQGATQDKELTSELHQTGKLYIDLNAKRIGGTPEQATPESQQKI